jgi:alpha-L-arabinofuranosidase
MGHRSADDYGKFALEAARLMKWTDPNIRLVAAESSNFGTNIDWIGWNRTVLDFLKTHADYLAIHMYVGNPNNDFGEFLASSIALQELRSGGRAGGRHFPQYLREQCAHRQDGEYGSTRKRDRAHIHG